MEQAEIEQPEDTSTSGILMGGWGIFLAAAGIISAVMDFSAPSVQTNVGTVRLFGPGSLTLGWLLIVGVFISPAILIRPFFKKACHPAAAVMWCIFAWVMWAAVHAAIDPIHPARPNLALFGGFALCWRLLTKQPPSVTPPDSQ
jgi:hypothetical protein